MSGESASPDGYAPGYDEQRKAMITLLVQKLFPICRSITGDGVRQTLAILQCHIPLEVNEVPSGTPVLDWTVPPEWNIRDAYIARDDGTHVVDFASNNLHVVQYSLPIDAVMPLAELRPHLHSLPEHPDWIPYRTSYYTENWGFCLTDRQLSSLADGFYRVVIDSDLKPGHLSYGELFIPGDTDDTVLFSCHICHPSLANDNLSGIAVATMLACHIQKLRPRHSYRFLFIPGTIGSLTWLARNEDKVGQIVHGLVLSCLGDAGGMTYKQSRRGKAAIDRIVAHVLSHDEVPSPHHAVHSLWVRRATVLLARLRPAGRLPDAHTQRRVSGIPQLGRQSFVAAPREPRPFARRAAAYRRCHRRGCRLPQPQSERRTAARPARALRRRMGGQRAASYDQMALLWVLNLADGRHSLLDMAERAGVPFATIRAAADALLAADLLELIPDPR